MMALWGENQFDNPWPLLSPTNTHTSALVNPLSVVVMMLIEWYPLYAPTAMQLARNRIITGLCTRSLAHNPLLSEVLRGLAGVRNPFHPSALL